MDILSNPTKHKSRVEIRKQKLADIGVNIDDIEDQEIEDLALPNIRSPVFSKPNPNPKVKDIETTFKEYGFKVSHYATKFTIKYDKKTLTEDQLDTKKYNNLIELQQKRMDKLLRRLDKGMLINFSKIMSSYKLFTP